MARQKRKKSKRTRRRALKNLSFEELQELFEQGESFTHRNLKGFYRGEGLAWNKNGVFPEWAEQAVTFFTGAWLSIWQGKTFKEGRGLNRIFPSPFTVSLLPFRVTTSPSELTDNEIVLLDYNLPINPPPMRKGFDELVKIGPQTYLGLMYFNQRGETVPFSFFALKR